MSWEAALPVITAGLGLAGQVAAQRSAARAGARQQEAGANMAQDRYAQDNYAAQQNATLTAASMAEAARLKRAQLGMDAPEQRTKQALWGDIIGNIQDAKISGLGAHIPKVSVSGGFRPSLIGPGGQQAGKQLQTQALQALMTGSDVPAMPDFDRAILTPPEATPLPQASGQDRWANIISLIGQFAQGADTVNQMRQQPQARPVAQPMGATGASDPWGAY
jgi:hypothetical protein